MPHFIFIQQISVLNILNMLYNLHFFSSKCRLFHNATLFGFCITHILNTGCAKIWKKFRRQKVKVTRRWSVIGFTTWRELSPGKNSSWGLVESRWSTSGLWWAENWMASLKTEFVVPLAAGSLCCVNHWDTHVSVTSLYEVAFMSVCKISKSDLASSCLPVSPSA
jgi:hypothetical protein